MKKYLLKLDLFARPITMTLNKKKTFRTLEGGFVSIFVLAVVLYITIVYAIDFLSKKNPTYYFIDSLEKHSPVITVNNSNFLIATRIEDNDSKVYDMSYFEITAVYETDDIINKIGMITYPLELKRCTNQNLMNYNYESKKYEFSNNSQIQENGLNTFYCPDLNETYPFGGNYTIENKYFWYTVKRCDNKTEEKYGVKCQSDEVLNAKDYFIGLKFLQYQINPEIYDYPVSKVFGYEYYKIEINSYKKLFKDYKQGAFYSDNNPFFENFQLSNEGAFITPTSTVIEYGSKSIYLL